MRVGLWCGRVPEGVMCYPLSFVGKSMGYSCYWIRTLRLAASLGAKVSIGGLWCGVPHGCGSYLSPFVGTPMGHFCYWFQVSGLDASMVAEALHCNKVAHCLRKGIFVFRFGWGL
eukprot:c25615_g4_i1 orf=41-385(+)